MAILEQGGKSNNVNTEIKVLYKVCVSAELMLQHKHSRRQRSSHRIAGSGAKPIQDLI